MLICFFCFNYGEYVVTIFDKFTSLYVCHRPLEQLRCLKSTIASCTTLLMAQ